VKSHELARMLLELEDLPVATHANHHTYASASHRTSHGPLRVGRLSTKQGDHIVIGNFRTLGGRPDVVEEFFRVR
jgi:hypothetical protein